MFVLKVCMGKFKVCGWFEFFKDFIIFWVVCLEISFWDFKVFVLIWGVVYILGKFKSLLWMLGFLEKILMLS